jgi:hypothetical protein
MSRIAFISIVLLITVLAACGPSRPASTPQPTATATAAQTLTATPVGAVDLAPFKAKARSGQCNDIRNRLFLIDDRLVFSDVAGNCADASYAQSLYGSTPDQVLCVSHDSIAGPVKKCSDERYQDIFNTMIANLSKTDLGLAPQHSVQPVPF